MSNCIKKLNFLIKLLKTGFVTNDKWRQAPGFDIYCITYCTDFRYAVTSFEIVEVLNFFSFEIGPLLYFFNHCFMMTCDFK